MDIKMSITRRQAAEAIVNAHLDQLKDGGQVRLYIQNGEIDSTRYPQTPSDSFDLYSIWEWTLGDMLEDVEDFEALLVESALDRNGLDLVPDSISLPDGEEAIIYYADEQ